MFETIAIKTDAQGICTLALNRPAKRNAMSAQMMDELHTAASELGQDARVRAIILCANGDVFCAGGDLAWMQEQMQATAVTRATEARRLAMMLMVLNNLPKPLIGCIEGNAFGGGVGLMSVCDAVFAARNAKFGLTETRLGLLPATIGPYVIKRIGEGRARSIFMSARLFDTNRAAELGLVSQVLDKADVAPAARAEARAYLSCAPGAVAEAKALAQAMGGEIDEAMIERSIEALTRRWASDEARDGVAAFFAKAPAPWMPRD